MQTTAHSAANAPKPSHLPLSAWWRVVKRVLAEADARNLSLVAAGVSFYALLSVFPAIAAIIAIWGFVADPQEIATQLDLARQLIPEDAFGIIEAQVSDLIRSNQSTLQWASIISILLAIWTARNGVGSLIRGLNSVYREDHRQSTIARYLTAIGLTTVLIAVALVAFAAVVILPVLLAFFRVSVGLEVIITLLQWLILLGLVLFSIGLLYRYGPNRRRARTAWITPGALFALVSWAAGSVAFSIYLRNFGSFNEVYGSIGAMIALLFWFYLSAYLVLLGAQLNAELELQTRRDTTVGDERPAGERQAFVADYVADESGDTCLADAGKSV